MGERVDSTMQNSWLVVRSGSKAHEALFESIMKSRFPGQCFQFLSFRSQVLPRISKELKQSRPLGVLIELKKFAEGQLKLFDQVLRESKFYHKILVLSPESYRILNQRRKKSLHLCTLVLSEFKSLDFLTQLPRIMRDVALKRSLHDNNQRLVEMVNDRDLQSFSGNPNLREPIDLSKDLHADLIQRSRNQGLRVVISSWSRLKKSLGPVAASELVEATSRTLTRTVRGSDRVLRCQENEFLVFLADMDRKQLQSCLKRLHSALEQVEITQNRRTQNLSFQVTRLRSQSV